MSEHPRYDEAMKSGHWTPERCAKAFEKELRAVDAENAKLREAVMGAAVDMHYPSDRPCPTCLPISKALREPWGCYRYHVRIGKPVQDFTKA